MHPTVWQVSPDIASMAVQCGALKAHPKMAIAALRKNAPVLVYPAALKMFFARTTCAIESTLRDARDLLN